MKFIFAIIILCTGPMLIVGNPENKEQVGQCPPGVICDPTKFDEYHIISWRDEKARLDNAAIQLQRNPSYIIYLTVYAGRRACIGEVQARAVRAKNYLVDKRGIEADRVLWKDGGYREEETVEVWVQPRGAVEPSTAPTVDKKDVQIVNCQQKQRRRRGHA